MSYLTWPLFFVSLPFDSYETDMRVQGFIILCAAVLCVAASCSESPSVDIKYDSGQLDEHKDAWRRFNSVGNDDSLIIYTRPVLDNALSAGDTLCALYCGVYMAQAWLFMEQTDSALYYLDNMRPYVERQQDDVLKYLYYSISGGCAIKAELNYSKAMECYQKAYGYASSTLSPGNRLSVLMDIIYIFYIRSDRQGMEYARNAYALVQASPSVDNRCSANLMMAMMLHICDEDSEASEYIETAWRLARSGKVVTLYALICKVYADICSSSDNYAEAEKYYRSALEYTCYADAGTETFVYLDYGRMLMSSGQYAAAEDMFERGLEVSYRYDNHECRKELLSCLIDNALLLNHNDEAVAWLENYRSYLDSVSNRKRELQFNSMLMSIQRMEYENEAQAVELNHLRARQRMLIYIAVLFVVIIVMSFLLFFYRHQRNTYRLLVEKYQRYVEEFKRKQELEVAVKHSGEGRQDSVVTEADRELFAKVENLMREQKVYRMKSLTRDSLADMLGTNRTYLSRAINSMSGKSFSDYLNSWRIVEATLIMSDKSVDIPLKQLADDLGYSSISVFYRSFQKETGVTAGRYMKEVRAV